MRSLIEKRGKKFSAETGASMTEYIIIVALVAVFLIGAVGLFGDQLKDLFTSSKDKLKEVKTKMNKR